MGSSITVIDSVVRTTGHRLGHPVIRCSGIDNRLGGTLLSVPREVSTQVPISDDAAERGLHQDPEPPGLPARG